MWGVYAKRDPANLAAFDRKVGFRKSVVTKGRTPGAEKRRIFRQILRKRIHTSGDKSPSCLANHDGPGGI